MKYVIAIVVIAIIIGVGLLARSSRSAGNAPTLELRKMALTTKPGDLGITPRSGEAWEVVMDLGFPNGSASVVALSDGNASLYFSGGGGVIGGGTHENVAGAAKAFVREATKHMSQLKPATELGLPRSGHVRFFVRASNGILIYEGREDDLGNKRDPLYPLFFAGQEVITQLRLISGGE